MIVTTQLLEENNIITITSMGSGNKTRSSGIINGFVVPLLSQDY